MKKILAVLCIVVLCAGASLAQTGIVPVTLNIGPMGGVVIPLGDFSDAADMGWNAGAMGRFGGLAPIDLSLSFSYASFNAKLPATAPAGTPTFKWNEWMLAVGPEFTIPSVEVKPYLGVDLMYTMLGTDISGSTSKGRGGVGLGAGVQFMNSLDLSAKYQMINLVGKEDPETTQSQIAIRLAYLFPVL